MSIRDLRPERLTEKGKFDHRTKVLLRASVPKLDLIGSLLADLDLPRKIIFFLGPVRKIAAVGKLVRPLDATMGNSISGRNLSPRNLRMPDYKRPLVLAELREHLIPEIFDRTFEFSGDGGKLFRNVNPLTRIMIHVEQATLVPQTKTLIPSSDPTLPTGNQSTWFPRIRFSG